MMKFAIGSVLGATLGATIGLLFAPKRGEELQADTSAYLNRIKSEGDQARQEAEARVAERFRQKVNDPDAFSSRA